MLNVRTHRTRGVSLVELLVGLVIGMIGVVIMMQIFSVSEGYKRTTTGGDDAQNNGAIGLYGLQRDLRQAGQGTNSFNGLVPPGAAASLIGCNVTLRAGVTINANALAALGILYAAAFANLPAFVADYNVRHAYEITGRGVHLDVSYLKELGPASLPALDLYIGDGKADRQTSAVEVRNQLYSKLQDQQQYWRSWTWAGERLLASAPPPPPVPTPRLWKVP